MSANAPITPLTIPADALASPAGTSLIIVGGTFDPPHAAHVALAQAARASLPDARAAWLLFVPAARSPHKPAPIASDADRLAMLRLATAGVANAAVWSDELDRASAPAFSGGSFTIDTLTRARQWTSALGYPPPHLHLLMGTDQVLALHRWREPHAILAMSEPLILARDDTTTTLASNLRATGTWDESTIARLTNALVPAPLRPESSTAIRARLATGARAESLADLGWLTPAVAAYIDQHNLYRTPTPAQ